MIRTAAGDAGSRRVKIGLNARAPPSRYALKLFVRSAFRRRANPNWQPDEVSQEERIAGVLIIVLLVTLFAAACAT
jgi:hypothetical protein